MFKAKVSTIKLSPLYDSLPGGLGNKTRPEKLACPAPTCVILIYCPTLLEVLEKFADRFPLAVSEQGFSRARMHHPPASTAFPSATALPSTAGSAHRSNQTGSRAAELRSAQSDVNVTNKFT